MEVGRWFDIQEKIELITLQRCEIGVIYKPGKSMYLAGILSCAYASLTETSKHLMFVNSIQYLPILQVNI
jgi:hypothetical protein